MWFIRPSRWWDWIQVEVSSQCPAACIYCPTTLFRKWGSNLLMSMETYHRLLPAFSRARMVFLQGWGEPFMNPNFFEMVRQAKAAGCQVGTTTNGMLLDADKLTGLVHSGVDIVAFSLAGCSETNDVIRKGTSLVRVLEAVRQLKRIKENEGTTCPDIHIAYMLLRSGLDEIEQLPSLLAGSGVSQAVVTTLDFVPIPALDREALIPSSQDEYASLRARMDRLAASGRQSGLDIRCQLVAFQIGDDISVPAGLDIAAYLPVQQPVCTENIQRAAFISAGGNVSPCVFKHLPVASPAAVAALMGRPYQPLIFGNIHDRPLEDIWRSKDYRAFRRSHHSGNLPAPCRGCLKPMVIS
ncbi:MAG: SPASM domain-containing protein [Deltaproteobacteria bacterium]|nr:SPASM domain-containing protein [Deltaproteobacteria bacterium]